MDFAQFSQLLATKLDPKSKFKLLDFFDDREISLVDALDPEKYKTSVEALEQLKNGEVEFLIWDDYISQSVLSEARVEAESLYQKGVMKEAGFGKEKQNDKNVRSDLLLWITDLQ